MTAKPLTRLKATKLGFSNTFGIETMNTGVNLINLYSEDNPILEEGQVCYFLWFNCLDYHRPLLCEGIIHSKTYNIGANILYHIKLVKIHEDENTMYDFVTGKQYFIQHTVTPSNTIAPAARQVQFHKNSNVEEFVEACANNERCISSQAFFVRSTMKEARRLKLAYAKFVLDELLEQVKDVEYAINEEMAIVEEQNK